MKKLLRVLLHIVSGMIFIFLIFLLFISITDFKPEEQILVYSNENPDSLPSWTEYDFLIWNIGYCGLDESMDFFYDGGKQVRPSKQNVVRNLDAVRDFLAKNDTVEFILLQEVDRDSRRSFGINLFDSIDQKMDDYHSAFGINYKVPFVPLPPANPMGRVYSGLQSLSKYVPAEVVRHTFPGNYNWPMGVFMLDRCFMVSRFNLSGGHELVVVNTHNSAYDDGSLRAGQMDYLKDFLLEEYGKGNFVVVGGDWNQSPAGFPGVFNGQVFDNENYTTIAESYPAEGWVWVWDGSTPTNRRVKTPYTRGETPVTLIDFYLLSPNIQAVQIKTVDLDFKNSDHQPVFLKLHLLSK